MRKIRRSGEEHSAAPAGRRVNVNNSRREQPAREPGGAKPPKEPKEKKNHPILRFIGRTIATLICLGVMDEERNPVFPDVPTCKEQGYDITYYTQRGMAAPLGVDDAIMTRLEEACAAAIDDPDFVTFMNNNGQAISYLDAQGYADYLKQAAVDVAAAMDAVGL